MLIAGTFISVLLIIYAYSRRKPPSVEYHNFKTTALDERRKMFERDKDKINPPKNYMNGNYKKKTIEEAWNHFNPKQ